MKTAPPQTDPTHGAWRDANQRALMAELALIREQLHRHGTCGAAATAGASAAAADADGANVDRTLRAALEAARADLPAPAALDDLCAVFDLSPFERAVLLMCAGIELDAAFAADCAAAAGGDRQRAAGPTFGLALAALPDAHWSALTPDAPLRFWRLVDLAPGPAVTTGTLRIDEGILHFLAGVPGMDERLAGYLELVPRAGELMPSHRALADQIVAEWSRRGPGGPAVIQLCGRETAGKREVAVAACAALGLDLYAMPAERLPQAAAELEMLQRFWAREAALAGRALLLDCRTDTGGGGGDPGRDRVVRHWVERNRGPLLVATPEPLQGVLRPRVNLDVRNPTAGEQRQLWETVLGPAAAAAWDGQLDRLASQFDLSAADIRAAGAGAAGAETARASASGAGASRIGVAGADTLGACTSGAVAPGAGASGTDAAGADTTGAGASRRTGSDARPRPLDPQAVWDACRAQSRVRMDDLAQRIRSGVTWDDLVLPERTTALLREVAVHVRQRTRVYEAWGFAAKSSRGLGVSAMFSGPSGTGKTLAAEVLANELRLDLYRIDLSQVVSKYIGETEKNLRRVFDAAEQGGAVLLFDEADALFGKRSEVKDSHDRYANIEVSYLLQRMEAYRGLAVLTTNMKDSLDPAFLRRIRFVVPFPFPDAAVRSQIWARVFPAATPTDALDVRRLSRLNVAGGNIRNVAMNAAFLAADADEPVGMRHLARAARAEFAKLEKPLPDAELEGWQ